MHAGPDAFCLVGGREPRDRRLAVAGGAVQESLRLWPTTLVVLRESRTDTEWRGQTLPAGTEFAIVSSVFHRDDEALEFADRFEPDVWLDGRADGDWPIIPFSEGPARCPGENVVLLTTSSAVSHLLDRNTLDLDPPDPPPAGRADAQDVRPHPSPPGLLEEVMTARPAEIGDLRLATVCVNATQFCVILVE